MKRQKPMSKGAYRHSAAWHGYYVTSLMKEEINVNGKKVLILIEPHALHDLREGEQAEYFTASYTFDELADGPGVVLLLEEDNTPRRFESPVQALEFANEKLLGLI